MDTLRASGDEVKSLEANLREIDAGLERHAMALPNFVLPDVPDGDAKWAQGAPLRRRYFAYSLGPLGDFEISSTISPTAFSFASAAISA
jgi:hypothetical protein